MNADEIISLTDKGEYDEARIQLESLSNPTPMQLLLLTEIYILQNKVDLAQKQVSILMEQDLHPYHQMVVTIMRAIIHWFQSDLPSAKSLLDQAFEYHSPDKMNQNELYHYWLAFLYNTSGIIDVLLGQSDKAKPKFEKAYPLSKQSGSGRRIAAALDNLGIAERYLGNYDAAIVYQHRVLDLRLELGDKRGIAITKGNLGELYEITGDHDQSIENTKSSLELFKELEVQEEIGQCYHNLGRVYYELNQLHDAYHHFKQAYEYRKPLGNPSNLAMVLYYLVIIPLKLGDIDTAKSYLHELKEFYKKDNPVATLYYFLARAHILIEDQPVDVSTVRELLDYVIEHNTYDIELTYIAITLQIGILYRQSDKNNNDLIFSYITQLKKLAHEKNNPLIHAELALLESKFTMLDNDLDTAIDHLNVAEELADENNFFRLQDKINTHRQTLTKIIKNPNLQTEETDQQDVNQYLNELLRRFHRSQS